jgi:hypothetical protein
VLLDQLIGQIATLASVYHKPPQAFVTKTAPSREARTEEEEDFDAEYDENEASFHRYCVTNTLHFTRVLSSYSMIGQLYKLQCAWPRSCSAVVATMTARADTRCCSC